MNFSIHDDFRLIDNGIQYRKHEIVQHSSAIDYILANQKLIILLANNDITSISIYLKAIA